MKKIFYIAIVLFLANSCNRDFLTETPSSSLPLPIAITDAKGLEKGVIGIYTALDGEQLNDMFNFSELITDNGVLSNENNGQYSEIYNMNYSPLTSKVNRFWNGWNDIVIKANWVLSYENKLVPKEEEAEQMQNLYSEAKILRAFARLKLAEFFCARYGGGNQELGLPINNDFFPDDYTHTYARSTVPDTYEAIEKDLLYAANNMSEEPGTAGSRNTRVGPLAANLLLSRMYLYERKWDKAAEYATIAEGKAEGLAILETERNFPFPPQSDVNRSSIFQFEINSGNNPGINSLFNYWTAVGDSNYRQFFATKEFYDLIPAADSNRKRIYTLYVSKSDIPSSLYIVRKFGGNDTNDPILLRKAEIVFNRVEATYYSNPIAARTELINWVKTNRYATYNTTATGTAILDEILKQRRIEFAFEGFRFMDLKRNDLGWTKGANYQGNQKVVAAGDRMTCLPIPNTEMITNPKMVQNPGYTN